MFERTQASRSARVLRGRGSPAATSLQRAPELGQREAEGLERLFELRLQRVKGADHLDGEGGWRSGDHSLIHT